ncbi:RING-H2 finger protein ATL46-like [Primulina tabacum]|uniref:RING-H2 finger protein ATL46-like n=1 Tax=Primulina tabacum TaxID=48773 RepID=UPI003F59BCE0
MEGLRVQKWSSGHAHLKISWIQRLVYKKDGILTYPSSSSLGAGSNFLKESSPPPSPPASKINPAVLFIVVILALLFFIAWLLHLLVRFLTKNQSSSDSDINLEASTSDTLERQLRQLFHLHDSGLDQGFIDALPVFSYKEIVGPKEPFDCAVCLCEFLEMDQLRLLPMCSHAFHIKCIDTWLMSNSTCPLCRGTLFDPDFSIENPVFDFDDFREEDECPGYRENAFPVIRKRVEIEEVAKEKGVFPVRLGKFKRIDDMDGEIGGETSSSKLDARRCYSMGSYQYLLGDVNLTVSVTQDWMVPHAKIGNRMDRTSDPSAEESTEGKKITVGTKTDSYSLSKIWLWSKKEKFGSSSDAHFDHPSSLNKDLPWIRITEAI